MKVGDKYVIRIDQVIYTPDGDPMALIYGVDHYTNPIALLTGDQLDYLEPLSQYNNLYYKEGYEKGYSDAESGNVSKYKLRTTLGSIVKSKIKNEHGDTVPIIGFYNGYYNGYHYIVSNVDLVGSYNDNEPKGIAIRESEAISVLEKAEEYKVTTPRDEMVNKILGPGPNSMINQYIRNKKEEAKTFFNGGTQVIHDKTGSAIGLADDTGSVIGLTQGQQIDDPTDTMEEAEKKRIQEANKSWDD